ncbi:MAG TPA: NADH-quinone oxidoreductase subunit J [Thermoleophilia bacterium]|nr:NADH-quinone oxidoreductase subunit J [Thermoleophilia bacterium]
MTAVFYIAGAVALISTLLVITRRNTIHALLLLVISLLAVAVVFYSLGAPFVAALEVIVYAGAIIVLFLFTVMLLNVGRQAEGDEPGRLRAAHWLAPGLLAGVLLALLAIAIASGPSAQVGARAVGPAEVGAALYGPYAIGVELASTLLLAALIGARHLGQRQREADLGTVAAAATPATTGPAAEPPAGLVPAGAPASAAGDDPSVTGSPGDDEPAPAGRPVRFWRKDDV